MTSLSFVGNSYTRDTAYNITILKHTQHPTLTQPTLVQIRGGAVIFFKKEIDIFTYQTLQISKSHQFSYVYM